MPTQRRQSGDDGLVERPSTERTWEEHEWLSPVAHGSGPAPTEGDLLRIRRPDRDLDPINVRTRVAVMSSGERRIRPNGRSRLLEPRVKLADISWQLPIGSRGEVVGLGPYAYPPRTSVPSGHDEVEPYSS
jgi:hypothetical protein